jgi:nucleotide-binding universal stress UspA family protein
MRRVLVGLNLSDGSTELIEALPHLYALGTREVVITHVTHTSPAPMFYRKDPTAGVFDPLTRAYAKLSERFSVELSVLSGSVPAELVHEAEVRGADVIVIGAGAPGEPLEERVGGTAWGVVRVSRHPVLLMPTRGGDPPADEGSAREPVSRILHPTDFSPMARQALAFVGKLSSESGLPITLLHVLEPESGEGGRADAEEEARAELASMAEVLEAEGAGGVEHDVRQGTVWRRILEACDEVPGTLLAMATRGRGLLSNLVLGSESREVVRRARVPLVLVPPGWRGKR